MEPGIITITKRDGDDSFAEVERRNTAGTRIDSSVHTRDGRGAVLHEVHKALAAMSPEAGPTLMITLSLGNEAMRRPGDVAETIAKEMERHEPYRDLQPGWQGAISDLNGQTVGRWVVA